LRNYIARLAAGVPKLQIIADVHADPEGQAYGARIAGLTDAAREVQQYEDASVSSVSSLLELPDEAFIRTAYRLILGRDVDPEGGATYQRLLQSGFTRLHVIKELSSSPEGASRPAEGVGGLRGAIRRYEKANSRTWAGWYLRQVKGVESDLPLERHIRAAGYAARALASDET
jgi:hypothetical protein